MSASASRSFEGEERRRPAAEPRTNPAGRILVFVGSRLLLRVTASGSRLPTVDETRALLDLDGDGRADLSLMVRHSSGVDMPAYGVDDDLEPPAGFRLDGLRGAFHDLAEPDFRAAGTARQRLEWRRTHRFCSRCGAPNRLDRRQEAMVCISCGQSHFPRIAPAVIVLVQRGPEALLGRSPHFNPGVYSTLAGFVEAGESLEECVHREIREEVGVRVTNLRYFGSQPHPFPHSLMIGFVADWLEGELRIDPDEIEDARWFTADDLPALPHPMSIARALVDDFIVRTR